MSVIINDFEIVLDRSSGGDGAPSRRPTPPTPAPDRPIDVRDLLLREEIRRERVRAD